MKAMVLNSCQSIEQEPLKLIERDLPPLQHHQVLIEVSACGVCRTDLHTVEGEIIPPSLPIIPGHEVVGRIVKLGEKVRGKKVGDRVGVPWFYCSCGECSYCQQQRENLCSRAKYTGFNVDGGYAEFMAAHEQSCYLLPDNYQDIELAPLLCGGVVGYRAFRISEIKPGEILGLYGFGSSAHIILQVAKFLNITAFVFTRSSNHQQQAELLGADWVGPPGQSPPELHHSAVVFTPAGESLPLALSHTRKGGIVSLGGIYMSDIPSFKYNLLWEERQVRSTANSTPQDVNDFLSFARDHKITSVVETFPLGSANQVLTKVKYSQLPAGAVLVMDN